MDDITHVKKKKQFGHSYLTNNISDDIHIYSPQLEELALIQKFLGAIPSSCNNFVREFTHLFTVFITKVHSLCNNFLRSHSMKPHYCRGEEQ